MKSARHAAVVFGSFTLLFCWIFARPLIEGTYLSESDLVDFFLPIFLAPRTIWSSYEFAGMPVFADSENEAFYLPHLLLGRGPASWTIFIMSAYVLGACFTYAYVYFHTRSAKASAVAGLGFSLSEAMLERLPHVDIIHSLMWLPLILVSIDGMQRETQRWRWAALGAFASANCVLAGHPQFAVYIAYVCSAYALVGAFAERAGRRYIAALVAMGLTAGLLSAVMLLPIAELSTVIMRQRVDFTEFVDYSNSPVAMLSVLFPTIAHVGREAPTYVGLGVLMLAVVGAAQMRANWRVGFWIAATAMGLLLGVGRSTPLAHIFYELPLHENFRIVARHLVFAAFGLAVLAAFGAAAIEQRKASRRAMMAGVAIPLTGLAAAGGLLAVRPDVVSYDTLNEALVLPLWNSDVWAQLAIAAVAAAILAAFCRYPRSLASVSVLLVFIAGDLLHAAPYNATPTGLDLRTAAPVSVEPSVHARRLATALAPMHQRLLAPAGAHRNDVVPAGFARVWRIPTASGYTSLLLDNVATLARLGMGGLLSRSVLAANDISLDLLAVRYLVYPQDAITEEDLTLLAEASRWREIERFRTSRVTDRRVDEDSADEREHIVYENGHALPRAWLAHQVVPVTDGTLLDVVRSSMFRDEPFDPIRTALVLEGVLPQRTYPTGESTVAIESIHDRAARLRVSSTGGGFLVLSESYYPGWRARIDHGDWQPVHPAFLALQGLEVPSGEHVVDFEFVPRSRQLGAGISAVGILALAMMSVASSVSRWHGQTMHHTAAIEQSRA